MRACGLAVRSGTKAGTSGGAGIAAMAARTLAPGVGADVAGWGYSARSELTQAP